MMRERGDQPVAEGDSPDPELLLLGFSDGDLSQIYLTDDEGNRRIIRACDLKTELKLTPVIYISGWSGCTLLPTSFTAFTITPDTVDDIKLVYTDISNIHDIGDVDGDGEAFRYTYTVTDIYGSKMDITDKVRNPVGNIVDIKLADVQWVRYTGEALTPKVVYDGKTLVAGDDYIWTRNSGDDPIVLPGDYGITIIDSKKVSSSITYTAQRHDVVSQQSLKDAEDWVFQRAFGGSKNFGIYKDSTNEQPVLVTAVSNNVVTDGKRYAIAAYFTNFRVFSIMPADEGTNYVTELISDSVNSQSTIASTVKNLTASSVIGSQSVSNSTTATVSSSVSGSESYSYTEGVKAGAEYGFTKAFKASLELSFSATQAFATGWGSSDSLSTSKSASYSVSIPMSPYTQAMISQSDTTSVYLTSYNCPIAVKYDVTLVAYVSSNVSNLNGVLHINKQISGNGTTTYVDRDAVFTFEDPRGGARGDLDNRITGCTKQSDMDKDNISWYYLRQHISSGQYKFQGQGGHG